MGNKYFLVLSNLNNGSTALARDDYYRGGMFTYYLSRAAQLRSNNLITYFLVSNSIPLIRVCHESLIS